MFQNSTFLFHPNNNKPTTTTTTTTTTTRTSHRPASWSLHPPVAQGHNTKKDFIWVSQGRKGQKASLAEAWEEIFDKKGSHLDNKSGRHFFFFLFLVRKTDIFCQYLWDWCINKSHQSDCQWLILGFRHHFIFWPDNFMTKIYTFFPTILVT